MLEVPEPGDTCQGELLTGMESIQEKEASYSGTIHSPIHTIATNLKT